MLYAPEPSRVCFQGFASGDLERDAAAVRLFADAGMEMLLAQVAPPHPGVCRVNRGRIGGAL